MAKFLMTSLLVLASLFMMVSGQGYSRGFGGNGYYTHYYPGGSQVTYRETVYQGGRYQGGYGGGYGGYGAQNVYRAGSYGHGFGHDNVQSQGNGYGYSYGYDTTDDEY
ncbi:glycine-rich protein 3-like [Anopheles stephensi]|uniref:glycine-rich protein 3-like n=1 Tax=Anopheles stephensi TaxID=30069 RepID=UPI001658C3B3|nr:glycine-rich protein 3-like [Anopheles stephensi]